MQKSLYTIFEEIDNLSTQKEKVEALATHRHNSVLFNIINLFLHI